MTNFISVTRIKEKDFDRKYNNEPIFISEKISKLALRIGKLKTSYYYKDRVNTIKLGDYPFVTLFEARQSALTQEGEVSVPEKYKDKKTLLEAIYGNPNLYSQSSYHSNEYIRANIGKGSYLDQYKNRTNTSAFIDKKNKMRLLADHYVDHDNNCTTTIDKLNGQKIRKFAEDYHLVHGKSALASKRLYNEWQTFFKWLSSNELIDNPIAGLSLNKDRIKVKRRTFRDPSFKPEEIHSLINSYDQMKEPYKWIHPFMMFTGRRMASVLRLEKSDIDFQKNIITFRPDNEKMSMNNSDSIPPAYTDIPMCKSLEALVKNHILPYKPDNEFLFPHPTIKNSPLKANDREMRDKVRKVTGIEGFNYKDIRTNVNTAMIGLGVDLRIRQFILGQKSEKVESRELQKPKSLSVNEIFYDKNSYLDEKREALNEIESLWISASKRKASPEEITQEDINKFLPQKDKDLILINNYLANIKSEPIKSLKNSINDHASNFMYKVNQFFQYQDYEDYENAKKLFTSEVELYISAFIFNKLKEYPNTNEGNYLEDWANLQIRVEEMPKSTWSRRYDKKKLKIAGRIIHHQQQYDAWKEKNKTNPIEQMKDISSDEFDKIVLVVSGKLGLDQAIESFNDSYISDGKDYSPETLGTKKRDYMRYYNKLQDLEISYFPYLFYYQERFSDDVVDKIMMNHEYTKKRMARN